MTTSRVMNEMQAALDSLETRDPPPPFNPAKHEELIAAGYERTHNEATFEDDGDAENGPHLTGGPAFDEYTTATHRIIIDHSGKVVHEEARDLKWEEWCEEQAKGQEERAAMTNEPTTIYVGNYALESEEEAKAEDRPRRETLYDLASPRFASAGTSMEDVIAACKKDAEDDFAMTFDDDDGRVIASWEQVVEVVHGNDVKSWTVSGTIRFTNGFGETVERASIVVRRA